MNVSINYSLFSIANITKGVLSGKKDDNELAYLLLDSRKLLTGKDTLFVSINNDREKTQKIITELYDKGVISFLIDFDPEVSSFPNATFIVTKNALKAFQLLAKKHRSKFNLPVIGITGSNGKTIIKEWLHQLLEVDHNIVRSPRSYNSQIGVPLSVMQIRAENTLGIFEAGISEPGEMKAIEKMIQPEIGIFSNIGDAHNEGFDSIQEKTDEKLKLFANCKQIIYCSDYDIIEKEIVRKKSENAEIFSWSKKHDATLKIELVDKKEKSTVVKAKYFKSFISIIIPFTDDASIENAIHCWCVMLLMEYSNLEISKRLSQLHSVEMRLELKNGINNCSIINDSYSSDIHSLQIALDFLMQQRQHDSHTVILSDILQSGKNSKELYKSVCGLLIDRNIQRFIGIGPELYSFQEFFTAVPKTHFFSDVSSFRKQFYSLHFHNESILLKGARIFAFEEISSLLEEKVHQTVLSINLSAISHNLKQYRNLLKKSTKIMGMVKAFSYGSGAYEIARVLQYNKIDYLAVAYTDEGVTLRKAGITIPIMVMNPEPNSFNSIVQYFLEPELFSFPIFNEFDYYIEKQGLEDYPVHIKLDTGMHRLGFEKDEVEELGMKLSTSKRLHVQTVFSHLIASNDKTKSTINAKQLSLFNECCEILNKHIGYEFLKHIANSSAISNFPEMQLDMVRTGIGLYGIDSNTSIQKKLRTVTNLSTTISQIKNVKAGETVGYGGTLILEKDCRIATIRIGYADGYHRSYGNGVGKVMIRNILAPVVGNICMDMTMVDISEENDITEGDKVEIFGTHLPVENLAKWTGTIPYEIMTNISQRVKRVYFEE
ncbi:MAG: bifunctional UDP-N-acetylmuramoyl-tripeptide:D-alanyl-D-alanine ligase/alanine racemase [Ginsengibacter sp.]